MMIMFFFFPLFIQSNLRPISTSFLIFFFSLSIFYFSLILTIVELKWVAVLLVASATKKTNLTLNQGSAVLFQSPKSRFMIWVVRRLTLMTSPSASIWFLSRKNKSLQSLLRPLVFPATSTFPKSPERTPSTSVFVSTLTTLFV